MEKLNGGRKQNQFPKIKKKKINHKQSTEKLYFGMNHAIPL